MNYRHGYHAGNFADVVKHAVLALIIEYLKEKQAPFRVIDAHGGAGLYDLAAEAGKTGEWKEGIGRIFESGLPPPADRLIAPYLEAVRAENPEGRLCRYPGSPRLVRRALRAGDRLIVNELHPEERQKLEALFAKDPQVKVMGLDAGVALKALLPPKERRGLVLIDPPFEAPGEFRRTAETLGEALRRFATGTYLIWYPLKDTRAVAAFHRQVEALKPARSLRVEFAVDAPQAEGPLAACGLLAINPPFTLAGNLRVLLPALATALERSRARGARLYEPAV